MKELQRKYALTLLKTCLKIEKKQPLFISFNIERIDFVRIVAEEAYKLGVTDIYYDISDPYLRHEALKYLEIEDLKKHQFWNKDIWNTYAEKGAAFLMLASTTPGLMEDIPPSKISTMTTYAQETRKRFDELRDKSLVPWCIAAVPTTTWAEKIFPKEKKPVEKLWKTIFKICSIDQNNPEQLLNEEIKLLEKRSKILNNLKIKKLRYTNSLGTNLEIELPKNHIWSSGCEKIATGKEVLVNYPTKEIFTSPNCNSANGIVYSSRPLSYQDHIIKDFSLTFKDGKVISFDAKEGKDMLESLLKSTPGIDYLGEVALVPFDSSISNSNLIFYETLFDENASCHLALGCSFNECIENGINMTEEELLESGLNQCLNHVDFMIGTSDLNITAITENNEEITIFENGNFSKNF